MISVTCEDQRTFDFDPAHTALIVIDFQRDFIDADGGCNAGGTGTERLAAIVPAAQAVVSSARASGIQVIHTREAYMPDLSDLNALKKQSKYVGREGLLGRCLVRGEPGHDFVAAMQPEPGEYVIDKPGFSAFYATDLEEHLRTRDVTHLIIMGVTYQCCVHSTLRDAVDRGYWSLTLDDCCAALDPNLEGAVRQITRSEGNLFGWIAHSKEFNDALESRRQ